MEESDKVIDLNKSRDPRKYVVLVQFEGKLIAWKDADGEQQHTAARAWAAHDAMLKTGKVDAVGVYGIESKR